MKKNFLLIACCILLLMACNNKKKELNGITKTQLEAFTDTVKLDTFKVVLNGDHPKDAKLIFTITSFKGKEIYRTEIKAKDLFASYLNEKDSKKDEEKIKFLTNEVTYFFDEEHFMFPAVAENENPDKNSPDKAFYQELKETKLNGFNYRIGNEVKIYIAWSAKEQKVKIYYKCC